MKAKKVLAFLMSSLLVLSITSCNQQSDDSGSHTDDNSDSSISTISKNESDNANVDTTPLSDTELPLMYTNPDKYKGRTVSLSGQIFSEPEKDESGFYLQIFSDPENYQGNTVVFVPDTQIEVSTNDYVKLTGIVSGTFSGTNAMGGTVSAPIITASKFEKSNYIDVMAPALTTLELNSTQTQLGYTVTLSKIELAENETRLYVTVKNEGIANFNLYSFNSKLIQNERQYEEQSNYNADYPEIQTDLVPGVTTDGIIVFPKIENTNFKVILEGYSSDYNEDFTPYEFDIPFEE